MRSAALAAFAVLLAGRAWAGPAAVKPASEGVVSSIKALLASPAGANALASVPALALVKGFDPGALTHRLVVGPIAARLPENFALLEAEAIDWATLEPAIKAGAADLEAMFQAEAKEIAAAVAAGQMSAQELGHRASDLDSYSRLFSLYGPLAVKEIAVVAAMARAARENKTLSALQGMAGELLGAEELARVVTPGLAEGGRLAARRVRSQQELDALDAADPDAGFASARAVLLSAGSERRGSSLLGGAMDIVGRSRSEDAVAAMLHVLEREPDHMARRDAARYLGESAGAVSEPLRERAIAELERHAGRPILANVDFSLAEMAKASLAQLGRVFVAPQAKAEAPKLDAASAQDYARKVLAISRARFPALPAVPPLVALAARALYDAGVSLLYSWLAALAVAALLHVLLPGGALALGFFAFRSVRWHRRYQAQRRRFAELNADADAAERRLGFPVSALGPIPRTPEEDAQSKAEFAAFAESLRLAGKESVVIITNRP
jgi:hypothetical protein